jgi:6-phosphogluconolactonase (cycloisomerase 2 family)
MASTVAVFHYDAVSGGLDPLQVVTTLPEGYLEPNLGAEIGVNAAGNVLYASNRGRDSVALFSIDPQRFFIAPMEHVSSLGKTPRFFTFDPTGQYLIVTNQDSDNLVVFRVHPRTGELRPAEAPITGIPKPSCLVFVRYAGEQSWPTMRSRRILTERNQFRISAFGMWVARAILGKGG